MNAFELYEAAFDSAVDEKPATAEYVQQYADGAFDTHISLELAQLIADKRLEIEALSAGGLATGDEYYHHVQVPLEDIEL